MINRRRIQVVRPAPHRTVPPAAAPLPPQEALVALQRLVGLQGVKETVEELLALRRVAERRRLAGLRSEPMALHMVFRGNPGTGKTTVARHLGEIFRSAGLLSRGQLVEAERADLVGEYIGHTALRTREMITRAQGGVLFVDEAYALARGGGHDFGREAIDTLVKAIEDRRRDLVVVLAGYPAEMNTFLASNPGLVSRLPIILDFPDYGAEELLAIAEGQFADRDYALEPLARTRLAAAFARVLEEGLGRFGNARLARNVVEAAVRRQARRIDALRTARKVDLMRVSLPDLPDVHELAARCAQAPRCDFGPFGPLGPAPGGWAEPG